jgi:hypothetical protein
MSRCFVDMSSKPTRYSNVLIVLETGIRIHEHCTAAEILVFCRETGFPIQTLQRWYGTVYVAPRVETKLNTLFKAALNFDLRRS